MHGDKKIRLIDKLLKSSWDELRPPKFFSHRAGGFVRNFSFSDTFRQKSFFHSFIHFNSGSKAHKQQTEVMT